MIISAGKEVKMKNETSSHLLPSLGVQIVYPSHFTKHQMVIQLAVPLTRSSASSMEVNYQTLA